MKNRDLSGVSRRDFMRVTKQFGMSSTLLALVGMTGAITLPSLAQAVESAYKKRLSKAG